MAIPIAPINFYLQQGNGQVSLQWSLVAGALSYSVQRSTDGVNYSIIATPTLNSYVDTSVLIGVNYYYSIASINGSGTSVYTPAQQIVPTLTAQMSLGEIRLRAQQRADRVNSKFVTQTEWNSYINQSLFEFYDLITTTYENYYRAPPITFITTGSTSHYPLPDGVLTFGTPPKVAPPFYKLLGVDCGVGTSENAFITLQRFNFIDRNKFVYPNIGSTFLGVFNMEYDIFGNIIEFIPIPSANQIIRLWYIPKLKQLLLDTDIADGYSGWLEYVLVDAARKALAKEESETSFLDNEKSMMIDRIQSTAANRDAGQPRTISDSRSSFIWGHGNGQGGWIGS